jgi:hypothetical protein
LVKEGVIIGREGLDEIVGREMENLIDDTAKPQTIVGIKPREDRGRIS